MKPTAMTKNNLQRESMREVADKEFFEVYSLALIELKRRVSTESYNRLLQEALHDWRRKHGWV